MRFDRLRWARRGQFSLWYLFWIFLLVVAYKLYPTPFHDFVQWVLNTIYDALGQSFGSHPDSPVNSGPHPDDLPVLTGRP